MTSSLPDFSPSPSAAPAADVSSLAGLFPAAAVAPAGGNSAPAAEFALLIGAAPGAPVAGLPSAAPEVPAGVVACARTSTRLLATPELIAATGQVALVAIDAVRAIPAAPMVAVDAAAELAAVVEPPEAVEPVPALEITRDMLEEAATFVTSLLQSLVPDVSLPEFSAVAYQRAPETVELGGGLWAGGLARAEIAPPVSVPGGEVPAARTPAGPQLFTLAGDGAIELSLDLAQFGPAEPLVANVEVSATLQRPGQPEVRVEAAAVLAGVARPAVPPAPQGREIIAGKIPARKNEPESLANPAERKFVFTGDKQVKPMSPVAGISVAKTESTMPVAPIEETRATRNPEPFSVLPQRADIQVAAPPAERITVPVGAPAGQNFAERAVETVTNLVDTQFSASMQKAGSVHLHLRFGGEDLSVRVELKDGGVQADFRTDSPELRSALAREWQVVAVQSPEQMRRYLEPVFAPHSATTPAGSDDAPTFSSRQQQQQQAQQDQSSRTPREAWADPASPFARRSLRGDSFIPEPANPRGPAYLPTSLRLSVLA